MVITQIPVKTGINGEGSGQMKTKQRLSPFVSSLASEQGYSFFWNIGGAAELESLSGKWAEILSPLVIARLTSEPSLH